MATTNNQNPSQNSMATTAIDMATHEKTTTNMPPPPGDVKESSPPTSSGGASQVPSHKDAPLRPPASPEFVPQPMYHMPTHHGVDVEDYFRGPRDINRHSKWPQFLRLHGSVLPKMVLPLSFLAVWATLITCIHELLHTLAVNSVLLTVLGFVVGLSLSFRSTTAYERFTEGRKYWAQLLLSGRYLSKLIWVHAAERHSVSEELGKHDVLAKVAALQLINAFAVALKHRLRFEPSTDYPDLAPLVGNLHTLAGDAEQENLHERRHSRLKSVGQFLGVPMAESNPRKLLKRSKENLGNTPLEILTYLSAYLNSLFMNETLHYPAHQTQAMAMMLNLSDVLTGTERVVNTPLPVAYSISIAQITWAYVLLLPFQLVATLDWVAIPASIIAGYIILGLAQIGSELENPFGMDVNDLPLDSFCHELANDIDALTAEPAPVDPASWMQHPQSKPLWPLSGMEFVAWEHRSLADIRAALRAKAESRDVKKERMATYMESEALTTGA
jgi:putative membrane protein